MKDTEIGRNVADNLMGSFGTIASMETSADPWDIMAVVAMVTVIAARMIVREPVVWEVSKKTNEVTWYN